MDFVNNTLAKKRELQDRMKRFSVAIFQLLDLLPVIVSTRVVSYQLGRSASSIGANYREANRAESRDDFIHKLGVALKEASETEYWLSILSDLYPKNEQIPHFQEEALEFIRILQASLRTLRVNKGK